MGLESIICLCPLQATEEGTFPPSRGVRGKRHTKNWRWGIL